LQSKYSSATAWRQKAAIGFSLLAQGRIGEQKGSEAHQLAQGTPSIVLKPDALGHARNVMLVRLSGAFAGAPSLGPR
jgi:hypothetical protein